MQLQYACARRTRSLLSLQGDGQLFTVTVQEADGEGNVQRLLVLLPRCWRGRLPDAQGQAAAGFIVAGLYLQLRRAGLRVPELELTEISAAGILHAAHEILGGNGFTVMAREIEIHCPAKAFFAKQVCLHAYQFSAFFVDCQGVEVVDLDIGVGTHGMRHGTGVLGKLLCTQHAYILDALDAA